MPQNIYIFKQIELNCLYSTVEPDIMMFIEMIPKAQINSILKAQINNIKGYEIFTNFNSTDTNLYLVYKTKLLR